MKVRLLPIACRTRENNYLQDSVRWLVSSWIAIAVIFNCYAFAQEFSISDLGTLGGSGSFAFGINNRGEITGSSFTASGLSHSFLYRQGLFTDLFPFVDSGGGGSGGINNRGQIAGWFSPVSGTAVAAMYDRRAGMRVLGTLGGHWAVAEAINNSGQVVGWSYLAGSTVSHAFLYTDGVMTDIGFLGHQSFALGLNDFGVVVGAFIDHRGPSTQHAFVYRDGVMMEINPFNDADNLSLATGINKEGQIIGWGFSVDGVRGFIEKDGAVTDLGAYFPYAINDKGQVVGSFLSCTPPFGCAERAFFYSSGRLIDLNDVVPANAGWELVAAFDINEKGEIVGYGMHEGEFRAFLLTAATEDKVAVARGGERSTSR